jgi:K+-sensing histidine kinase KdpD
MAKGAMIGSALTPALALSFMKQNGTPRAKAATVLIGSALGALAGAFLGATKAVDSKISQSMSGHKLIREVIKNLERAGYKKDIEWTTDPKKASLMKTKVCIVISRSSDELGLLVNMASDPELKKVSAEVVKNLPWGSKATEKVSDRFNEIQISSIPAKTDATYIFGKIEKFIQAGFPVYLIEVG